MSYNEWLDIDVLEDYLDGKLDAKAMHRVEKLSLEDPFVAEALAGLSQSPRRNQSLSLLQKQLQERIAQKPVEQKRWTITSQRLSIAAAAAVLFVTVSVLFWMRENSNRSMQDKQAKKVDVRIAPELAKTAPVVKAKDTQVSAVMDKAIADIKTNTYAAIPKAKTAIKPAAEPAVAMVKPAQNVASARVSYMADSLLEKRLVTADAKKEVKVGAAQALSGRMAGVQVNTAAKQLFRGKVLSKDDGQPIPGVSIFAVGTGVAASTNAKGEFSIALDSLNSQAKLSFNSLGFNSKQVELKPNELASIELETNHAALSEVVVVAAGAQKKREARVDVPVTPVAGWAQFEEYLLLNNKLLQNKTYSDRYVTVQFDVDRQGRPVRVKTVKGFSGQPALSTAENEEAIRLVKEGPNWIIPAKNAPTTTVKVKF